MKVFYVAFIAAGLLSAKASAQGVDYVPPVGILPTNAYHLSDIDTVDTSSGNLMLHIPLFSLPQKGSLSLSFSVRSNNSTWTETQNCDDPDVPCVYTYWRVPPLSSSLTFPTIIVDQDLWLDSQVQTVIPRSLVGTEYNPGLFNPLYWVADGTGARHPLAFDQVDATHLRSSDGSNYTYYTATPFANPQDYVPTSPGVVYEPNGIAHYQPTYSGGAWSSKIVDPSSNTIQLGSGVDINGTIVDSFNRSLTTAPANSTIGCPTISSPFQTLTGSSTWTVPSSNDLNNGSETYLICYATIHMRTDIYGGADTTSSVDGGGPYFDYVGDAVVIESIVLPDHSYWGFRYLSADKNDLHSVAFGDLQEVILPTGGTIAYTYATEVIGEPGFHQRVVTSKNVSDGSSSATWNYDIGPMQATVHSPAYPSAGNPSVSQSNDTVFTYENIFCTGQSCQTALQKTDVWEGPKETGTLLQSKEAVYRYDIGPYTDSSLAVATGILPKTETLTIPGAGKKVTSYEYGTGFTAEMPNFTPHTQPPAGYDWQQSNPVSVAFGTVTEKTETDFDGQTILRTTNTTPYWLDHPDYYTKGFLGLPETVSVTGALNSSSTTYSYDENNGSPQGTLGNLTTISKWLNTTNSNIKTQTVYNPNGMPHQTVDGRLNTRTFGYDSTGAFISSVTAGGITDFYTFDSNTGLVTIHTDPNNVRSQYVYADPLNRITQVNNAIGTSAETRTAISYPDATSMLVASDLRVAGDGLLQSSQTTDGLGRVILKSSPDGSKIKTVYRADNKVQAVSNPYFAGTVSIPYTSYLYDAVGRMRFQCQADNSQSDPAACVPNNSFQQSSYAGNTTTFTDEKKNAYIRKTDALGNLTDVTEPNGAVTHYTYDVFGNLWTVHQGGLAGESPRPDRGFTYDSLSRLLTSNNPEAGVICYGHGDGSLSGCQNDGYDANGNVIYKTDARGILSHYTFDSLNRITNKSYSDGATPSVSFNYDESGDWGASTCPSQSAPVTGFSQCNTVGRLSSMYTSGVPTATVFGYDAMGRVTMKSSCLGSICGYDRIDQFFAYDLAGNLASYDHGTDATRNAYYGGHGLSYDDAGRLQKVTSTVPYGPNFQASNPPVLFTASSYGPAGLLDSTLGNGLYEVRSYDNRLRQESYNVVNPEPAISSSFSGNVESIYNSDLVRFPGIAINATGIPQNGLITVSGWVGTAVSCPVASVEVDIDGTAIGEAALGVARSDVQTYYNNDGQHQNCGFTFNGNIGDTAVGSHAVSVVATDSSGNRVMVVSANPTITISADSPPSGNFDGPPSQATYVSGALITISGWAIDSEMHAPVAAVQIRVDGVPIGYATTGTNRSDVASYFNDQRYTNSGWTYTGSIGSLTPGQHQISAVVYDSGGQSVVLANSGNPVQFNVTDDPTYIDGHIDNVFNVANGTATLALNGTMYVNGWVGEVQNTASCASNISRVDILVDGNYLGQAQVGADARSDVAAAFNNQSCLISGWHFYGPITNVDPGEHNINVRVYDESGGSYVRTTPVLIQLNAQMIPAPAANVAPTKYSWALGYEPNGNVGFSFDSVNGNYSYLYDSLNRLTAANSTSNGFQWTYDSFGNRLSQVLTGGTGTSWYGTFNTKNQPAGMPFDLTGNAQTASNFGPNLSYDGEERLVAAGATTYLYDALGQRVAKYNGSNLTNAYIYDNSGHVVTEFDGGFNVTRREVYAGRHLATYSANGTFSYVLADWLGTERARVDANGVACQTSTSQPFGDNQQASGTCFDSTTFFTGKERDAESELDNFGARYYASSAGRFMSPDWSVAPAEVPYATLSNPQSLNLYSYVGNNPIGRFDSDGHVGNNVVGGGEAGNTPEYAWHICSGAEQGAGLCDMTEGFLERAQQQTPQGNPGQPTGADGKPAPPPVPMPGAPGTPWVWQPDPNNDRGGTWGPGKGNWDHGANGNAPSGSWEEGQNGKPGHWDVDNGRGRKNGGRSRYGADGTPIPDGQQHRNISIPAPSPGFAAKAANAAMWVGAAIVFVAYMAVREVTQ